MAFPDGFVEDVRRAADIVRVVGEQVSLRKAGNSWKGLCPFHREKSPSFHVRADPPLFHCFGCGEGGDVFKFAMLYEKTSFPETVENLARRFGVPVPQTRVEDGPQRRRKEQVLAVMEAATVHFQKLLGSTAGASAREYLLGRDFTPQTLERIRAGAARDSWDDLGATLGRTFSEEVLLAAGLLVPKQTGRGHYDRFRGRVVFPILNDGGAVVAFGARCLDGSEPKYLNSPETPVYQKGKLLYGFSWARDAIRKSRRVVLMEGYLDVARAIQCGVGEAVATCGTALTPVHAKMLRRLGEKVIVNFDQDEAGIRAARRSVDLLLDEGTQVFVVELPAGHDPDSYLRELGTDAYRERLEQAPPFMEWLIRRTAERHELSTPAGKAAYLNDLLPSLVRVSNGVERAAWLPRIVERAGIDQAAAREELRRAVAQRSAKIDEAVLQPSAPRRALRRPTRLLPAEQMLLTLLLRAEATAPEAVLRLAPTDIERLRSKSVLLAAQAVIGSGGTPSVERLAPQLDEDDLRLLREVALAAEQPLSEERGDGQSLVSPEECVRELKRLPVEARLAEIRGALAHVSGAAADNLLNEMQRLSVKLGDVTARPQAAASPRRSG